MWTISSAYLVAKFPKNGCRFLNDHRGAVFWVDGFRALGILNKT